MLPSVNGEMTTVQSLRRYFGLMWLLHRLHEESNARDVGVDSQNYKAEMLNKRARSAVEVL